MNYPPTFGHDATPPYARSIPMIAFWKRIDAYTSRLSQRGSDLRFSALVIETSPFTFARQRGDKKPVGIPSIDLILT